MTTRINAKEEIKKGTTFTLKTSEPVVVMPENAYEELMDLIEAMSNKKLWRRIASAEKRIKRNEFVRWEDLKRKYGI